MSTQNGDTALSGVVRVRMTQPVLPETLMIATVCFLDMAWTITAVDMGIAKETNPLLIAVMGRGMVAFALVKMFSFLVPLSGLEILRSKIPGFVAKSMRVGLALYLCWYGVASMHVHGVF